MTTNLVRVLITTSISLAAVTASRSAGAAPRVTGCVNVQDFLADPADSATDDAAPIRSAIAAALATSGPHVVCLPGGVYNLLTTAAGQDVFDLSAATDLAIVGEGPATVLKLGDVGASSMQVFNLASGSARIRFQDLVIDGTEPIVFSAPLVQRNVVNSAHGRIRDVQDTYAVVLVLPQFLRVVHGQKVTARMGEQIFDFTGGPLEAMRDIASRIVVTP